MLIVNVDTDIKLKEKEDGGKKKRMKGQWKEDGWKEER